MTSDERFLMWRVPGILEGFVDVLGVGLDRSQELIERVIESGLDLGDNYRTIGFWCFRKHS